MTTPRFAGPHDTRDPLFAMWSELRKHYLDSGSPSMRQLAATVKESGVEVSHTTIHKLLTEKVFPADGEVCIGILTAVGIDAHRAQALWREVEPVRRLKDHRDRVNASLSRAPISSNDAREASSETSGDVASDTDESISEEALVNSDSSSQAEQGESPFAVASIDADERSETHLTRTTIYVVTPSGEIEQSVEEKKQRVGERQELEQAETEESGLHRRVKRISPSLNTWTSLEEGTSQLDQQTAQAPSAELTGNDASASIRTPPAALELPTQGPPDTPATTSPAVVPTQTPPEALIRGPLGRSRFGLDAPRSSSVRDAIDPRAPVVLVYVASGATSPPPVNEQRRYRPSAASEETEPPTPRVTGSSRSSLLDLSLGAARLIIAIAAFAAVVAAVASPVIVYAASPVALSNAIGGTARPTLTQATGLNSGITTATWERVSTTTEGTSFGRVPEGGCQAKNSSQNCATSSLLRVYGVHSGTLAVLIPTSSSDCTTTGALDWALETYDGAVLAQGRLDTRTPTVSLPDALQPSLQPAMLRGSAGVVVLLRNTSNPTGCSLGAELLDLRLNYSPTNSQYDWSISEQ